MHDNTKSQQYEGTSTSQVSNKMKNKPGDENPMNNQFVVKGTMSIATIVLPSVAGAILSNYLGVAWIFFLFVCFGLLSLAIYWYFAFKFQHIDVDLHRVEKQVTELQESLGTTGKDKLSWIEFWSKIQTLVNKIDESHFQPDIVISIGRSGAVLGGIMASLLKSTRHIGVDRVHVIYRRPNVPVQRDIEIDKTVSFNTHDLTNKKVLCVMSECSTGKTLSTMYDHLKSIHGITVKTAVLFSKLDVTFTPDYIVVHTDEGWPQLPFRIEGKWMPHHPQRIEGSEPMPGQKSDHKHGV